VGGSAHLAKIMLLAGNLPRAAFFLTNKTEDAMRETGGILRSDGKWRGWLGRAFLPFVLILPVSYSAIPQTLDEGQADGSTPSQHHARHPYTKPNLDVRVNRFAKGLDLSESQQSAVKKILEERQKEILRMRLDPTTTGSFAIDRFRALQERTVKQIRAVLNEEQKKQYDPLAARKISPEPNVEDWLKAAKSR
jgi:hypothetical protein